jgi:hypothetical protein
MTDPALHPVTKRVPPTVHTSAGGGWIQLQTDTRNGLNRPGESGDSVPWKGWSHVSKYIEEVPGRVA